MTYDEYLHYLDTHQHIEHKSDDTYFYFRNPNLPWYQRDPSRSTRIAKADMAKKSPEELHEAIHKGLEVEVITRITGYFTRYSSWNKGKQGEFKDRYRVSI